MSAARLVAPSGGGARQVSSLHKRRCARYPRCSLRQKPTGGCPLEPCRGRNATQSNPPPTLAVCLNNMQCAAVMACLPRHITSHSWPQRLPTPSPAPPLPHRQPQGRQACVAADQRRPEVRHGLRAAAAAAPGLLEWYGAMGGCRTYQRGTHRSFAISPGARVCSSQTADLTAPASCGSRSCRASAPRHSSPAPPPLAPLPLTLPCRGECACLLYQLRRPGLLLLANPLAPQPPQRLAQAKAACRCCPLQ